MKQIRPSTLLRCVSIAVFCQIWPFTAYADPYFSAESFGECVIAKLRETMTADQIRARFAIADERRVVAGSQLLEQQGGSFMGKLSWLAPFSQQDMSEIMAYHSMPLIDYDRWQWGDISNQSTFVRYTDLLRRLNDDPNTNLTDQQDFLGYLNAQMPPYRGPTLPDSQLIFVRMLSAHQLIAEPLVIDLIGRQKQSLTHIGLLNIATDLYEGDALTALGVIGAMFDSERVSVSHRNKRLVLASRLHPLFEDHQDLYGDNYHFWLYMNAAIQGKSRAARIMSVSYEGLQGDSQDRGADDLGLTVGEFVRRNLEMESPHCSLQ